MFNCKTGDKSVAQHNEGTHTLSFFILFNTLRAYNIKRFADDPELTNTECLVPNQLFHLVSNSIVLSPFVNFGYVFNQSIKLSIS